MRCIAQTYAAPETDGTKIGTTRRSADFPATGRIRCGEQVCRVTGFQTSGPLDLAHRADLEIGDTAGLENCATILGTPWLFSTRFVSGLALRFLRIKAIRCDKNVDSIDTLRYARDLAQQRANLPRF